MRAAPPSAPHVARTLPGRERTDGAWPSRPACTPPPASGWTEP